MLAQFEAFLKPPVFPDDEEKTRAAEVLHTFLLGINVILFVYGLCSPILFVAKFINQLMIALLFIIAIISYVLLKRCHIRAAGMLFASSSWFMITVQVSISGGMESIFAAYYVVGTVIAGLILGARVGTIFAIASSLAGLGMLSVEALGYRLPKIIPMPPRSGWIDLSLALFLTILALNLTIRRVQHALGLAQQQLKERSKAEAKLKHLLEFSPTAIAISDENQKILFLNQQFTRLFGYNLLDIPTVTDWFQAAYPEEAYRQEIVELWEQGITEYFQTGNFQPQETTVTCKDGAQKAIEFRFASIGNSYITSFTDLTERNHAQQALLREKLFSERLLESLPAIFYLYQFEDDSPESARLLRWNAKHEQVYDYTADELPGMRPYDFIAAEEYPRMSAALQYLFTNHEMGDEGLIRRRNGTLIPYNLSATSFVENGKRYFMGVGLDISARVQAENAVKELASRWQATFDAVADSICMIDANGTILQCNHATQELFAMTDTHIIGQKCYHLMHGKQEHIAFCPLVQMLKSGQREKTIIPVGERWVEVTTDPVRDSEGKITGAVHIISNITDRKRAEEQVFKLNAELEQRVSERTAQLEAANKELEAFSYSVSHDLRAPLRHLTSFSQILMEEFHNQLSPEAQNYLQRIENASRNMNHLIEALLDLSRLNRKTLQRQTIDISALAAEIIEELHQQAPERMVAVYIQPNLFALGDLALIRNVLENLLGNAWKFTSQHPNPQIEFGQQAEAFYVRDNGVGFDMAYADKLFTAFQRLHRADEFPGTGIGLATVQRILHRHGGQVWAESALGQGATFFFTLQPI